ncbi:MAG: MOSC N-terminal beta barrel domain-containing protein [Xenococcaceae cyanobacterium]
MSKVNTSTSGTLTSQKSKVISYSLIPIPFMSHLARIVIFPIKSLDGVEVDRATLLKGGALVGDRSFAIYDTQKVSSL